MENPRVSRRKEILKIRAEIHAKETKETMAKINKWDLIKIKSFCTTKENISKVKKQPSEWEKIIANETTDKQLISKMNNTLLNNRQVIEEIKKEIKICIEANENTTTQNLWDTIKAVLRGKFIAIQACLKK